MQPGVKGLRSLLLNIALTHILSTLNFSMNKTFFLFWELFEGIAVETRKIQCNMTARLFSGTSAARFALRSETDKRIIRSHACPENIVDKTDSLGVDFRQSAQYSPNFRSHTARKRNIALPVSTDRNNAAVRDGTI